MLKSLTIGALVVGLLGTTGFTLAPADTSQPANEKLRIPATADLSVVGKPACCVKRAYCCQIQRSCCR